MKDNRTYWRGLEELNQEPEFLENAHKEFPDYLPVQETTKEGDAQDSSRRDFLKLMGFSVAAVSLAACEAPVRNVVPLVNKVEGTEPGIPNWFASSYVSGSKYASVLVKTREGRPILLEKNEKSSVTGAGLNSQVIASVLSLYDSNRYSSFLKNGEAVDQENTDKEIIKALKAAGSIRVISESVISPSTQKVIAGFLGNYSGKAKHVQYDAASASGVLLANNGVVPGYDFSKADVIVGVNCDFMGTWISPTEFSAQYAKNRKLNSDSNHKQATMSKHFQFETGLTVTGAAADERESIKPSQEGTYLLSLYNELTGASVPVKGQTNGKLLSKAAKALKAAKGRALVVSGSNDPNLQSIVTEINKVLGAEGATINTEKPILLKQGSDKQMLDTIAEIASGKVDAVIFMDCNPVFDHPLGGKLEKAIANLKLSVSTSSHPNETSSLVQYNTPSVHGLEKWGDALPKRGEYSLIQPTITKIFAGTRQVEESLLVWSEASSTDYFEVVKKYWQESIFPASGASNFRSFWNKSLHDGVVTIGGNPVVNPVAVTEVADSVGFAQEVVDSAANIEADSAFVPVVEADNSETVVYEAADLGSVVNSINKKIEKTSGDVELQIYESTIIGTGDQANNPWLQECPDPISKVTWDNYAAISIADAAKWNVKDGDALNIIVKEKWKVTIPVLVQPGQAPGSVSVAMGYGRTAGVKIAEGLMAQNIEGDKIIGVNANPFISIANGTLSYGVSGVSVSPANISEPYRLARTQTHHTIMGRHVVQESTLSKYKENPKAGRFEPKVHAEHQPKTPSEIDVWQAPPSKPTGVDADGNPIYEVKTHEHPNHHWGLVIDLNSCNGCSACIVSCHAENNVPVVGRDEVLRRREMHWMRIDRYYSSDAENEFGLDKEGKEKAKATAGYDALEHPAANPKVTFQPMLCQHCNHAPCETVCPVAATTHSSEGMNQMTYNRCIGTRYCANNCPYKVRRFNWFNYSDATQDDREFSGVNVAMNTDLGKMVLNPDVVVRARGVMEKCSLCVQRIQAGKLQAKKEKRRVKDGDIVTACQASCATGAIVFGDMNDPESRITQILEEENPKRAFNVLEEINVKPNISYLTKIRNS